jgi:hypothetical protein
LEEVGGKSSRAELFDRRRDDIPYKLGEVRQVWSWTLEVDRIGPDVHLIAPTWNHLH